MKIKLYGTEYEAAYLAVDAGVRYWNDASINGEEDTDCEETRLAPTMPFAQYIGDVHQILRGANWRWRPIIDIDKGQILGWPKDKTARIQYKVCDDFTCSILDEDREVIASYDGYVPEIMYPGGDGWGDYILMYVDQDGIIHDWDKTKMGNLLTGIERD